MLIMRKVAQAASAGNLKEGAFEQWWPAPKQQQKEVPSWAKTSVELRKQLIENFQNQK